jgi:hypothetical protein
MSPDIVKLVIENKYLADQINYIDDVDIAYILNKLNDCVIGLTRTDLYMMEMFNKFIYDNDIYHYRIKWHDPTKRHEEGEVMLKILDMINYNIDK